MSNANPASDEMLEPTINQFQKGDKTSEECQEEQYGTEIIAEENINYIELLCTNYLKDDNIQEPTQNPLKTNFSRESSDQKHETNVSNISNKKIKLRDEPLREEGELTSDESNTEININDKSTKKISQESDNNFQLAVDFQKLFAECETLKQNITANSTSKVDPKELKDASEWISKLQQPLSQLDRMFKQYYQRSSNVYESKNVKTVAKSSKNDSRETSRKISYRNRPSYKRRSIERKSNVHNSNKPRKENQLHKSREHERRNKYKNVNPKSYSYDAYKTREYKGKSRDKKTKLRTSVREKELKKKKSERSNSEEKQRIKSLMSRQLKDIAQHLNPEKKNNDLIQSDYRAANLSKTVQGPECSEVNLELPKNFETLNDMESFLTYLKSKNIHRRFGSSVKNIEEYKFKSLKVDKSHLSKEFPSDSFCNQWILDTPVRPKKKYEQRLLNVEKKLSRNISVSPSKPPKQKNVSDSKRFNINVFHSKKPTTKSHLITERDNKSVETQVRPKKQYEQRLLNVEKEPIRDISPTKSPMQKNVSYSHCLNTDLFYSEKPTTHLAIKKDNKPMYIVSSENFTLANKIFILKEKHGHTYLKVLKTVPVEVEKNNQDAFCIGTRNIEDHSLCHLDTPISKVKNDTLEDMEKFLQSLRSRKQQMTKDQSDSSPCHSMRVLHRSETRYLNKIINKRKQKLMACTSYSKNSALKEKELLEKLNKMTDTESFEASENKIMRELMKKIKEERAAIKYGAFQQNKQFCLFDKKTK